MSRKRSEEAIEAFRERFIEGAARKGVDGETADKVYDKLAAFSGFGFPKSHAAAFGLLAYQSAWLRHHYPAEFLCALLNAQPMGFYPPSSLVRDAQRRGVEVLPPDVNESVARCVCVSETQGQAVRLGLQYVKSVGEDDAEALIAERDANGAFLDVGDLARRVPLDPRELQALVRSGACDRWGKRRDLLWELGLVTRPQTVQREHKQLSLELDPTVTTPDLPDLTAWERMLADYATTSVSIDIHPLTLLRPHLPTDVLPSDRLNEAPHRSRIAFAGMVVARQRPATARGIIFMLLEDEFGQVNLIVSPELYERNRAIVRGEPLLLARGRFERIKENRNIVVESLESLGPLARRVSERPEVGSSLPGAHHFGHR